MSLRNFFFSKRYLDSSFFERGKIKSARFYASAFGFIASAFVHFLVASLTRIPNIDRTASLKKIGKRRNRRTSSAPHVSLANKNSRYTRDLLFTRISPCFDTVASVIGADNDRESRRLSRIEFIAVERKRRSPCGFRIFAFAILRESWSISHDDWSAERGSIAIRAQRHEKLRLRKGSKRQAKSERS